MNPPFCCLNTLCCGLGCVNALNPPCCGFDCVNVAEGLSPPVCCLNTLFCGLGCVNALNPPCCPAPVHPAGWPKRQSVRVHAMPLRHGLVFLLLLLRNILI